MRSPGFDSGLATFFFSTSADTDAVVDGADAAAGLVGAELGRGGAPVLARLLDSTPFFVPLLAEGTVKVGVRGNALGAVRGTRDGSCGSTRGDARGGEREGVRGASPRKREADCTSLSLDTVTLAEPGRARLTPLLTEDTRWPDPTSLSTKMEEARAPVRSLSSMKDSSCVVGPCITDV